MVLIKPLEKLQEIQRIRSLKSAVDEAQERLSVLFLVVQYEIVRGIVHQPEKFIGLVDDSLALAPGEHGRPEGRYFDVLQFLEAVRHANGVVFDETRLVEPLHAVVEVGFQVCIGQKGLV